MHGECKIGMKRTVRELQDSSNPAVSQTGPQKGAEKYYPGFGKMFLIWTVIGVLTHVRNYFLFPAKPEMWGLSALVACAACYYPWIVFTPIVFRIERRFPMGADKWARNLVLLAIVSVPFCLLASPLMLGSFVAVVSALRDPVWMSRLKFSWYREFPVAEAIFWCSAIGGYFIRTLIQLREQERKATQLALEKAQLEAGLNQAQLEVLRARLNPHFLFNSLQNISVMTKQDPQTASRMLTRLGDLLRAVLRQDSQPESTLQEEIALTQAYTALEQMRFGDRLHVDFKISPEVQQAMVPCFILQPLIENAIIHGLRGARKTGIICVSALRQERALVLTVTDNGIGLPAEDSAEMKKGVGLRSTCERLARMYPDRHAFSIRKHVEGGAEVRIEIPLRLIDFQDRSS
jgi:two-component system, LytTR family, sensor kinase